MWEEEPIQRSSYKKCGKLLNFFMTVLVLLPGIPAPNLPIPSSVESENTVPMSPPLLSFSGALNTGTVPLFSLFNVSPFLSL